MHNFHFALHANITRNYVCGDGVDLTDAGTNFFAGNIINFLNYFVWNVKMNGFLDWQGLLDWHGKAYIEEKDKTKNLSDQKIDFP